MFRPDTCELLYYRSQNADINDFDGKIQLRRASFNFAASDIKDNIFTINADGATHMLQVEESLVFFKYYFVKVNLVMQ